MISGKTSFVTNSQGLRLWTERFGDPADPVVLLIMGTAAQAIGWPDELVAARIARLILDHTARPAAVTGRACAGGRG